MQYFSSIVCTLICHVFSLFNDEGPILASLCLCMCVCVWEDAEVLISLCVCLLCVRKDFDSNGYGQGKKVAMKKHAKANISILVRRVCKDFAL